MARTPSPLYVLLSSPSGWLGTPQETVVLHAVGSGHWKVDPAEVSSEGVALPAAIVAGFNRISVLDGAHARALPAFKTVMGAVLQAGGVLPDPLPSVGFSQPARQWLAEVCREQEVPGRSAELALAHMAVATLHDGQPKLKGLRAWCQAHGMDLSTPLAGAPLLAHVAVAACRDPLRWKNAVSRWGPEGWLLSPRSPGSGSVMTNRTCAHQRLADAMALADWVDKSHPSPLMHALWWAMVRPLSFEDRVSALPERWQPLSDRFTAGAASPHVREGLKHLLDLAPAGALQAALAANVLAAVPELSPSTPAGDVWELTGRALALLPLPSIRDVPAKDWWSCEDPAFTVRWRATRNAVRQVIERWGWPTVEWASGVHPPWPPAQLANLWLTALAGGAAPPCVALGAQWRSCAQADPQVPWPSLHQLERWVQDLTSYDPPAQQAAIQAARRWHQHCQTVGLAYHREQHWQGTWPNPGPAPRRPRM